MTTAQTPSQDIVYKAYRKCKSKRSETHYLLVNGRKVRVKLGVLILVEFDCGADEPGPVFSTDYVGAIYRYSDREWCEKRGTYFYPFATREEAELFNAIIDEVAKHAD